MGKDNPVVPVTPSKEPERISAVKANQVPKEPFGDAPKIGNLFLFWYTQSSRFSKASLDHNQPSRFCQLAEPVASKGRQTGF